MAMQRFERPPTAWEIFAWGNHHPSAEAPHYNINFITYVLEKYTEKKNYDPTVWTIFLTFFKIFGGK